MRRYLFLLAILLLPLLGGGNDSWGFLIGLVVIPLLFAWEVVKGGFRLHWKPLAGWAVFLAFILLSTSYVYPTLKIGLWLVSATCAYALAVHYLSGHKLGAVDFSLAMTVSALLTALYGLFLYSPHFRQISPAVQLSSTFGLHNSYAALLLLTWPLAATIVRRNRGQSFALITAILLVAFLLTFSRAAYIALAVQLAIIGVLALRDFLHKGKVAVRPVVEKKPANPAALITSGGVLLALVLLLVFTGLPASLTARIASIWNAADYSLQGRLTFWAVSWKMFLHSPVQGIGLGNFGWHYPSFQPDWRYYTTDPHSFVLQILAETGVVGLLFAVWLVWRLAVRVRRGAARISPQSKWAYRLILVALAGFTLHALVDFDFTYLANMVYFAVVLAVAQVPVGEASPGDIKPPSWLRGCAIAGAVAFAFFGTLYASERAQLDRAEEDSAALAQSARVLPWNAATHIDLALAALGNSPPDFASAVPEAERAAALNRRESQAPFLISQCPEGGTLDQRITLASQAIKLDPYNRPHYYWGLARLLREKGDTAGETSALLSAVQHFTGITEPIGPDFPRPYWIENNITFASIYLRLSELMKDTEPTAAVLYRQIGLRFLGATHNPK